MSLTKEEQKVGEDVYNMPSINVDGQEWIRKIDHDNILLTALRNKEKEVWERVKECVPFSQMHTLPDGVNSRHETEYDRGWNKCRELTLANIKNLSK